MATSYPDAKSPTSLADGKQFEKFMQHLLETNHVWRVDIYQTKEEQYQYGETKQGYEFKLDNRCTDTGRLSIEIAEKSLASNRDWIASGIYRDDNTVIYIHGNYQHYWAFDKKVLRRLHASGHFEEDEMPTIRKFYLPRPIADEFAMFHEDSVPKGGNGNGCYLSGEGPPQAIQQYFYFPELGLPGRQSQKARQTKQRQKTKIARNK